MESSLKVSARSGEPKAPRRVVSSTGFALGVLAFDLAIVLGVAVLSGVAYQISVHISLANFEAYVAAGLLAGVLFALPRFVLELSVPAQPATSARNQGRLFGIWTFANFVLALTIPEAHLESSLTLAWSMVFYGAGLVLLPRLAGVVEAARTGLVALGRLRGRRVMVVGPAASLADLAYLAARTNKGLHVVAEEPLPVAPQAEGRNAVLKMLDEVATKARTLAVDDIIVSTDGLRDIAADDVVARLSSVPVSIHVQAPLQLGHISGVHVAQFADVSTLVISAPPLDPIQRLAKRLFDVAVATAALILLSPLFLMVAVLIKMSSPGPVFFRQRRRGYNMTEFQIWKFRTMTVAEDGADFMPASRDATRLTWVGRYLRRFNVDELPQLLNVLKGDMTIVGPRPHAIDEDVLFAQWIAAYAQRTKIAPGITGWAQVNGCRGRAHTVQEIRQRVEHDLHYMENWSILFDLYIMALTVFSPRAYRNAK